MRLSQSLLYAAIVAKHADLAGVGDISIEGRVLSKAAEAQWSLTRARRCRSEMAIKRTVLVSKVSGHTVEWEQRPLPIAHLS